MATATTASLLCATETTSANRKALNALAARRERGERDDVRKLRDEVAALREELRVKSGALFILKVENEALRQDFADLQKRSLHPRLPEHLGQPPAINYSTYSNSVHTGPSPPLSSVLSVAASPTDWDNRDAMHHRTLLAAAVDHLETEAADPDLTDGFSPSDHTADDEMMLPPIHNEAGSLNNDRHKSFLHSSIATTTTNSNTTTTSATSASATSTTSATSATTRTTHPTEEGLHNPNNDDDDDDAAATADDDETFSTTDSSFSTTQPRPTRSGETVHATHRRVSTTASAPPPPTSTGATAGPGSDSSGAALARRYMCTFCSKRFTRPSTLQTHMNSHTGHRPFKCHYCEMRFTVSSNMKRHMGHCHNK